MELAAEIGLDYHKFLDMTWADFEWVRIGYERRLERKFDTTRQLIAAQFNSSGFSKKKVSARDVMRLPYLDRARSFRKVERKSVDRMLNIIRNN